MKQKIVEEIRQILKSQSELEVVESFVNQECPAVEESDESYYEQTVNSNELPDNFEGSVTALKRRNILIPCSYRTRTKCRCVAVPVMGTSNICLHCFFLE